MIPWPLLGRLLFKAAPYLIIGVVLAAGVTWIRGAFVDRDHALKALNDLAISNGKLIAERTAQIEAQGRAVDRILEERQGQYDDDLKKINSRSAAFWRNWLQLNAPEALPPAGGVPSVAATGPEPTESGPDPEPVPTGLNPLKDCAMTTAAYNKLRSDYDAQCAVMGCR